MWTFALPIALAQETCPEDPRQAVDDAMGALLAAYASVDDAAFDGVQPVLARAIGCLAAPLPPGQLGRLHVVMALTAFVNGQSRAARRALASARLADPGWRPPEELFPESHPFYALYESAGDPGPVERIGSIKPDLWVVDGYDTDQAPVDRAFLLQVRSGADGGAIVWSGYLYDWEEIPNRGQNETRSAMETPHTVTVAVGAIGRQLASRQGDGSAAWPELAEGAVGGGLGATARFTPVSVVGGELGLSVVGPVDPVAGGGAQPSGHALLLLGGGAWVAKMQPYGALRVGVGHDRVRAWPSTTGAAVPRISGLTSAVLGLEGGVRREEWRSALAADFLLAGLSEPFQVRVRADGGRRLGDGPFALDGGFELRASAIEYVDGGRTAGRRKDTDVRLVIGLGAWF